MGSLSNLYISQSYQSLIHIGTNNTASAALIELQDGLGNNIGVAVNTAGNLFLSGSLTASLQNGYVWVGAANGKTTTVATSSFGGGSIVDTGSLVTTASFNAFTQSINSATASLFTSASLALVTASFDNNTRNLTFTKGNTTQFSVNIPDVSGSTINTASFATTASFNSYTQSTNIRLDNLESTSASVNVSITNLNSTTSSFATSISNLNTATASLFTSASLAITTASVSGTTMTFVKGNGTTFNVTLPTGSGGGGTTDTGSLLVTASAFTNTITFTKGDGTTFPVTVTTGSLNYVTGSFGAFYDTTTQSGSAGVAYSMKLNNTDISDGVIISGSGGIKVLAAGTYDLQFSAQVLAATGADTVWIWLKKNGINVADTSTKLVLRNNEADVAAWNFVVSANANDVFELAWQSLGGHTLLFAEAAASNYTAIPSVIATMNRVDVGGGTNLVSTASFNSYTASNDQKVNSLIAATGSFATTGSNVFTGSQTFADSGSNRMILHSISGSLVYTNSDIDNFLNVSGAINTANTNAKLGGNLLFKTQNNQSGSLTISGSSNLVMTMPTIFTGFKSQLTSQNLAFTQPALSASMAFPVNINTNIFQTAPTLRGPVSSSTWTIASNYFGNSVSLGTSAANHFEKAIAGVSLQNNNINGTISAIANTTNFNTAFSIANSNINQGLTINAISSSVQIGNSNMGGLSATINNRASSSLATNTNNFLIISSVLTSGQTTVINADGASATNVSPGVVASILGGTGATIQVGTPAVSSDSNQLRNNIVFGQNLNVTGSNSAAAGNSSGGAFLGRCNSTTSRQNDSSYVVFAVGTGTNATTGRKTGFLIDSGSNTFVEGTLNVSGSTTITGSLNVSGSNTILSSSVSIRGNTTFTTVDGRQGDIIIGDSAMANSVGVTVSIAIGASAMRYASGSTQNVAIGQNALLVTSGSNNFAIGSYAMENNTTGNENTAIGTGGLNRNLTGGRNVGIGGGALFFNQDGGNNVAIGYGAGQYVSSSSNVLLGYQAGANMSGSRNVILGGYTGLGDTGNDNIILATGGGTLKARYDSGWAFKDKVDVSGSLKVASTFELNLPTGSNQQVGTAVLDGGSPGTVTVSNSKVTANSIIMLTKQTNTTPASVSISAKSGGSFTIESNSNGDTDTVGWFIINNS